MISNLQSLASVWALGKISPPFITEQSKHRSSGKASVHGERKEVGNNKDKCQ